MTIKTGAKIKELRGKTSITQERLANHLGISTQAICRWENESCYPDMELIPAIAQYFGVSADYLLDINNTAAEEKSKDFENQWTAAIKDGKPQLIK